MQPSPPPPVDPVSRGDRRHIMEWGFMTILGPILLAAVLAWAMLNNRRSRAEKQRPEEATRIRREQEERDPKAREAGGGASRAQPARARRGYPPPPRVER